MSDLVDTFAALADPTRLAVVNRLRAAPCRSSELADELDTSRAAMSKHLKVLRRAGLVEEEIQEEDARVRVYRLRRDPFSEARTWIEDVEAFWADQLESFRQHVAAKKPRKRREP